MKSYIPEEGRIVPYLDDFPFSFYIIIQDPQCLPNKLGDALKQWFDLANSN